MKFRCRVFLVALPVLLWPPLALAAVHALFNLETPKGGPFPSDRFTVEDRSHLTGLRVSLPSPDCSERPSDCEDMDVINTLDGFNNQPRLSIPFDGPIDVDTVGSRTVFLIELRCRDDDDDDDDGEEECDEDGRRGVKVVGINQVVWDTFTNTLHVESDELLDQHTRYALIVTRGIRDEAGRPVEATQAFRRFRQSVRGPYKRALLQAIHAARRLGVREDDIAVASVFTTLSSTAIMEKIRDQIKAATPAAADFLLGPGGTRTVFALQQVTSIMLTRQNRDNPPGFATVSMPLASLGITPSVVGHVAFGKYVSPSYRTAERFIPEVGTLTGTPEVQGTEGTEEIYFNLFLPAGARPAEGWPVALLGTGGGGNKDQSTFVVAKLAQHGIATMVINAVGHGLGPLGTVTVNGSVTFPLGGRGSDADGNGTITVREGEDAAPPRTIISNRDGVRQTVADYMQLVRVIEGGMDVDGNPGADLDPSRIYYSGFSYGANYGTALFALEPNIRAAALYSQAGPNVEQDRLAGRGNLGAALEDRTPPLVNSPGIILLDGRPITVAPFFNENMPLRDGLPLTVRLADQTDMVIQSPVINAVPGAMEIQEVVENTEWVSQSGNPVAYARHLRMKPLAGVSARPVLYLYAKGDRSAPNPNGTAVIRAGDLADRVTFYRHDLAHAENPALTLDPHAFINLINSAVPLGDIARGAQDQIATFLASDGATIIHPEPARFFEVPIVLPLPEGFNFIIP